MDALGNIFRVNLLGYAHWFMSIKISQMKYHSISIYQAIYDNYISEKYLDTATVKKSKRFYKPTLPYDMIFTRADKYTSYDQVEKLTR